METDRNMPVAVGVERKHLRKPHRKGSGMADRRAGKNQGRPTDVGRPGGRPSRGPAAWCQPATTFRLTVASISSCTFTVT
jgi:hypothetical protein